MTQFAKTRWATVTAAALAVAACGGGGGGSSDAASGSEGSLRLALTDAPACGYDEVNVTVVRVQVNKSGTADAGDGGWETIELAQPKRVNLLELTNGVLEELGSTRLPAGAYQQLRLVLASNDSTNPMANSVVPTGGAEVALDTPSAQQSGLKMNVNIQVAANQTADLVLDFDACKSVVPRGMSGRYNLKPVISVLPRVAVAGLAVEGYLAGAPLAGAAVSLQQAGTVARATVADSNGRFVLSPVPAGTYDLVITAEGRVTAVMTGVPVTATGLTAINTSSAPITLASSDMRAISGTVATTGSSVVPDATVRALQNVGTATVELFGKPVDADAGSYSFQVPVQAPVVAAYSPSATTYTFSPVSAAAAKYSVQALVAGKPAQVADIDVSAGDATADFNFAP